MGLMPEAARISARRLVLRLGLDMFFQAWQTLGALTLWANHNHGLTFFFVFLTAVSTFNLAVDLTKWRDR